MKGMPSPLAGLDALRVLDHGLVRLVDFMGGDLSIVRAARVSYAADWRAGEDEGSDAKLVNYLMRNRHTTPFEAVAFTWEVKAPIFDFRQWHRHRTWSYNEVSARYTALPEEFYIPDVQYIGMQSTKNKQARTFTELDAKERTDREAEIAIVRAHCEQAFVLYRKLLERGWPRELARIVLPLGTYSHMFASVNLHNLFHFLRLRLHSHAQYEIRVYAEAMLQLMTPVVPVAVAAFNQVRLDDERHPAIIKLLKDVKRITKAIKACSSDNFTQRENLEEELELKGDEMEKLVETL